MALRKRLQKITRDDEAVMTVKPFAEIPPGRYREVSDNFTISLWVKPDVDMGLLPANSHHLLGPNLLAYSYAIYPPSGTRVYGKRQAACGLAAARDGVVVYERSQADPQPVLVAHVKLSGWTHIALVYRAGEPSLFMNGKLVGQGKKSPNAVHPGLGEAFQRDGACYFYGGMSEPKLFSKILSQEQIRGLVEAGVPDPESPPILEPFSSRRPELLIWQNGHYSLQQRSGRTVSFQVSGIVQPREIRGPWRVTFPPDLGAPAEIGLPELTSLHRHREEGVRYFSGTATYRAHFQVKYPILGGNRRLYLDLGRVAVVAQLHLNGRDLGVLWKAPFLVDVTEAIRSGENELEIQVTNLWTNRLIGDEHLPAENEYSNKEMLPFFGGAIKQLPQWYLDGKPKPPGGRITFATWKHYDKDSPLVESGLIGPVLLRDALLHGIEYS